MKFVFIFFVSVFSANAFGCFLQPEGLAETHESIFAQKVGLGLLVFLIALICRFFANKSKLWIPSLFGISFGYLPITMYVMFMEGFIGGGGACGRNELLEIGDVTLIGFSVIALYEVINLVKVKRAGGADGL